MSCSKITEKADEEPEDEEADDTLIVIVKPDGTVSIDQETFNRVMESKKETMNIIHFENSSNKGITVNPENGEQEINLTVQGFYPSISTKTFLPQANENSDITTNNIYLDHCYYKDCPPNIPETNICSPRITLSTGIQHITNELKKSNIVNEIEEIEEITVSVDDDIKSGIPSITVSNNTPESNLPNNKRMLNLRVGKNEKQRSKAPISLRNTMTKKKPDEIQSNQSGDKARATKTVKRLLPMKTHQVRPSVQNKNNRQKKSDVIVDKVLLQANELIRQSSIEPKKYIQNQLMFKKNKDKIGIIDNSLDSLSSPQKFVTQLLDVPELFSAPDIILDDNKTSIQTANIELDSKIDVVDKIDDMTTIDNFVSNTTKDIEQVIINKEETGRVRKVSNRMKDNPVEITVTKTVEDILNDISSKIANQTEIIDEENLIDELADLNEDLNSSNFVAPSNSSHDLMNRLLSDDSLSHSEKNDSITSVTDDKPKGSTIVVYGKSGRVVTLPPIEIPKTRSLVKKENLDASIKEQGRQRRSSENSKSINDYSEESDTDREGNMTSEDDPNRLWCVCRKPHNNRFMICCDTCEDWFHGKCVGITKALGEQMEARGVEWNCPPCKKKRTEDARKKSEEEKAKKLEEEKKKISSLKSPIKNSETKVIKTQPQLQQKCAQCDKTIDNVAVGLFCKEICLEKHIEESVAAIKACCTSDSPDIILFDKKNSRLVTGDQAPKLANLKQWMKENPAFQILKPSGPKTNLNKLPSSKPQTNSKSTPNAFKCLKKENENRLKRPAVSPDKHKAKEIKKEFDVSELLQPDKIKLVFVKKDSPKSILPKKEPIKQTTPQKEPNKHTTPQKEPNKPINQKEPIKHTISQKEPIKHAIPPKESSKSIQPVTQIKTTSLSKINAVQKVIKKKPEPIKKIEPIKEIFNEKKGEEQLRSNVRKSLLESLSSRISEEPELKTAEQDLEELISKIEEELFNQFSKVDQKYKTKYRSLLFNIKDPKNLNFFKKIMFKWVTPYQLVRMTADEMASQELAEWRERENKHQIEMIRKTELDMMNQPKALLMKTHKGEEIIESKDNKETIVSELNPDIKVEEKKPQILLKLIKEKKKSKYKERSSSGERDRRHHKSSRNRHKSHRDKKRRSRDRSRDLKDKKVEKNKVIETVAEPVTNNIEGRKDEDISDREPSSTVVIATPPRVEEEIGPIWKGTINFTDVARCNVTMSRLSGNVIGLEAELTLTVLECVGRIKQQTVWEYMGKLKKTGTKDIIVTKLSAGGMEQQMSYLSLYQYLSAKNRIAVIDSKPFPNIKDFYLYPLGSHSPIPQVLLPLDGPGIDDYRTHLLLGIIVRNSKKHWVPSWKQPENNYINDTSALPHLKPAFPTSNQDSYSPKESYTPPRSPTNKILSLPTPVLPLSSVLTDDDLPYIPGEEEPYSPVDEDVPSLSDDMNTASSIEQQMEELTRKIEKEKLVIQMMTAGSQNSILIDDDSQDLDEEVYSPTSELAPLTSEIQLPSNIKDILSSINTKELPSTEAENSKITTDVEKKCRDPRQRISAAEPPPPGLEDEFTTPCNPDISLPPPNFPTPYMQPPINYIAPIPYPYPPPGYMPDAYPNQYGPQQPPPPPPNMVLDQGKYNNYNQPGYAYNTAQYQPPPPPSYPKTKKGSGFWGHGSSKHEPKKKKFKKSGDRRDKGSWRRM
ncbi:PHD finger protein 3 [Myzus persicae]|uniref:PHD finger protein 3 n=1 Tax=Myzus persicae TaxID=13164 RepID=UPI000B934760|nr:PHD finger protein 3 [Myzus persicae]XP_022168281.1 PHD finger protein 3 [Myzus persicae]XP_022168282.1 PHD finger protein 3 [Myzus persicae]